jgi:hypothetical protein
VGIKNNLVYGASLTSGGFTYRASNNIVGQDPKFVDLAGKDFHLQAGSSAIGRGDGSKAPMFDHDRKRRPTGKICDIGAYEYLLPKSRLLPVSRQDPFVLYTAYRLFFLTFLP